MNAQVKIEDLLRDLSPKAIKYLFPGLKTARPKRETEAKKVIDDFETICYSRSSDRHKLYCARDVEPLFEADLKRSPVLDDETEDWDKEEKKRDAIVAELEIYMTEHGLTLKDMDRILNYIAQPSPVKISSSHKIILTAFNNVEVKMDKLSKTLFLFYLEHPEGVRFKDLQDYRSELEAIYLSISDRSDMDAIHKSIEDLTNPLSNSINEKVSRLKKAFCMVMDERIAKFYCIDGPAGEPKRIALDPALITWGRGSAGWRG